MRRSKSNPAKYTRNYRSISQRRMTQDNDDHTEEEMQRLRNLLRQGEKNLQQQQQLNGQKLDESRSRLKQRSEEASVDRADVDEYNGILSQELLEDDGGYNNQDQNALIVEKKKATKQKRKTVRLNPQELKQAKQLQKNAARKLKQLETRAAQKEKRKQLYSRLQETALSSETMNLLSSSATLGKKMSKKEKLQKLLQKERAGMKLSSEEHDLLYMDRSVPDDEACPLADEGDIVPRTEETGDRMKCCRKEAKSMVTSFRKAETDKNLSSKGASPDEKKPKKMKRKRGSTGTKPDRDEPEAKKTYLPSPVEEDKTERSPQKTKELSSQMSSDFKPSPASTYLAAQMMASLTTLKTQSKNQSDKAAKLTEEAERKRKVEDEQRNKPSKRHIPSEPVVLKTAAALGKSRSDKLATKFHKKVREVKRPIDVAAIRYDLPVATMEFEIMDAIRNNDVTVVCAETGSGKSTQVPQFLYESGLSSTVHDGADVESCMIGVTQTRRVAAISTAKRVCYEMGRGDGRSISNGSNREGNLVAYQTRYETAGLGSETHIKFMTDGILLQEIQSDLLIRKYSVIVLDEAHERGLNSDVLIGLLSAALPLRKEAASEAGASLPPLKLVIMSATLRVEDFTGNKDLFSSTTPAVVRVPGRTHPVTLHHNKVTELDNYEDVAFKKVCRIHRKLPQGGILVFLTGKQEILRMVKRLRKALSSQTRLRQLQCVFKDVSVVSADDMDRLRDMDDDEVDADIFQSNEEDANDIEGGGDDTKQIEQPVEETDGVPKNVTVLPLYSLLSTSDQAKVFAPVPEGHRLIVIATNIAETSITIPGISYVVDSGRQKCRNFNAATGMASFDIMWISKAAADQRAGRAGRTGPGHCYRLYSSSLYARHMDQFALPEVLTRPLEDVVLAMKAMKISNVAKFPFPTPPDRSQIGAAVKLLANLGCIDQVDNDDGDGTATRLGLAVSKLPLGVRFGKMLLIAAQAGVLDYAIAMVAALSETSPFVNHGQVEIKEEIIDSDDENEASDDEKDIPAPPTPKKWRHRSGDVLAAMLAVGGYTYAGRGAGGASEKVACRKFCEANGLNPVVMERIQKMRIHLARLAKLRLGNAKGVAAKSGGILSTMSPPSRQQEQLLCQSIASGLLDNIAMLAPLGSIPGEHPFSLRSAYLRCSTAAAKDPLYMNRNSVVYSRDARLLPQWICFESLTRKTLKDGKVVAVMQNITPIDPSWLGVLATGTSLLSTGEPLPSPAPVYSPEKDAVLCSVTTKFGNWEIPPVQVELFDALQTKKSPHFLPDDSFRWFARFLLEGKVLCELRGLAPMLNDSPALMTRRTPTSKVGLLVASLAREGIDSAAALRQHWAKDRKFLYSLVMSSWVKTSCREEAKKLWIDAVKKNVSLDSS